MPIFVGFYICCESKALICESWSYDWDKVPVGAVSAVAGAGAADNIVKVHLDQRHCIEPGRCVLYV